MKRTSLLSLTTTPKSKRAKTLLNQIHSATLHNHFNFINLQHTMMDHVSLKPGSAVYYDKDRNYYIETDLELLLSLNLNPLTVVSLKLTISCPLKKFDISGSLDDTLDFIVRMVNLYELSLQIIIPKQNDELQSLFDVVATLLIRVLNNEKLQSLECSLKDNDVIQHQAQRFFTRMNFLPALLAEKKNITSLIINDWENMINVSQLGKFFNPMIGKSEHMKELLFEGVQICESCHPSLSQDWWNFLEGCTSLTKLDMGRGVIDMENIYKTIYSTRNHLQLKNLSFDHVKQCSGENEKTQSIFLNTYSILKNHPSSHLMTHFHSAFTQHKFFQKNYQYFTRLIKHEIMSFLTTTNLSTIKISSIELANNQELITNLKCNTALTTLHLIDIKKMDPTCIVNLLENIHLKELHLVRADINNIGLLQIAAALTKNTFLQMLDLSWNVFNLEPLLESMCMILDNNSTLRGLRISYIRELITDYYDVKTIRASFNNIITSLKKNCTFWDFAIGCGKGKLLHFFFCQTTIPLL